MLVPVSLSVASLAIKIPVNWRRGVIMCFLVVYSLIIAQNRRRANFRNHECQPKLSVNAYSLVLKDPHSPVVIGAAAW